MQNQNDRPRSNSMDTTTRDDGPVKMTRSLSYDITNRLKKIAGKRARDSSFDESYIPKEASQIQIRERKIVRIKKSRLNLDSTQTESPFMSTEIIKVNNARAPKNNIPLARQPACFFDEADFSQAFSLVNIGPKAKKRKPDPNPRTGSVSPSPQDLFEQLQRAQAKQSAGQ